MCLLPKVGSRSLLPRIIIWENETYIRQVDISFLIIFVDSDFEMMIPYCVQL